MSVLALPSLDSALTGAPFLAAGQSTPAPPPAPANGQEFGSASTLGFVVLVLFFIAVAFLARSMAKHLKRVQKPFEDAARAEQAANEAAANEAPGAAADSRDSPSPDSARPHSDAAPSPLPEDQPADATPGKNGPSATPSAPEQHKADA